MGLYSGNKNNEPQKSLKAKFRWRRSSKRSASNSNQGPPNTQTLPTLTLFLPLSTGAWFMVGFFAELHWKSDFILRWYIPGFSGFVKIKSPKRTFVHFSISFHSSTSIEENQAADPAGFIGVCNNLPLLIILPRFLTVWFVSSNAK